MQCSRTGAKCLVLHSHPFSVIGWVTNKLLRKNIEAMILVALTWQTQPSYTLLLRIPIQCLLFFSSPTKAIIKSSLRKISSCENQTPKVSGLENWKKNLRNGRNFKQCSQTYPLSRGPGSIAGYKSAWNKWVIWCCQQQIDRVCAPLSEILNYLSTLFEKGLQYRT